MIVDKVQIGEAVSYYGVRGTVVDVLTDGEGGRAIGVRIEDPKNLRKRGPVVYYPECTILREWHREEGTTVG